MIPFFLSSVCIPFYARLSLRSMGIVAASLGVLYLLSGHFFLGSVRTGLPTLAAAFVWNRLRGHKTARVFHVSLLWAVCTSFLFLMHSNTVGGVLYVGYWLFIPFCVVGAQRLPVLRTFFYALITTLVAHSIGSLLLLYTVSTSGAFWAQLVFIVWYERLILAGCLLVIEYVFSLLQRFFVTNRLRPLFRTLY